MPEDRDPGQRHRTRSAVPRFARLRADDRANHDRRRRKGDAMKFRWGLALLVFSSLASAQDSPQLYFGADLSYVNELEDCGATWRAGGKPRDVFELFHERGGNLVRVRLWNDARWTRYSNLADVRKTIR